MFKTLKATTAALAILGAGIATQAVASTITYDLTDAPHSRYQDGGFYNHVGGNTGYQALSFEKNGADAKLIFDQTAGTVRLKGTGYNIDTNTMSAFDVFYDNVALTGDKLSLNNMGKVGTFEGTDVRGKGFNLTIGETLRGDGWLANTATGNHFGDFHFTGVKVPNGGDDAGSVPAPAPLFLLGAAALFGFSRRKKAARA